MRRMNRMRKRSRGTGPRTTKKTHPGLRSARACPSHASRQPLHIKVLSDLFSLFLLISIDIKVFQTFGQSSRAAPSCKSCSSWPSCFRQLKRWRGTGPRTTAATNTRLQVQRTLMAIERRRNTEKRSVRTLMSLASEAGWPGFAGWPG